MRKIFLVLGLIVGLAGCAMSTGQEMTQEALNQLVVNQTTKAEMLAMFGQPVGQGYDSSGKMMVTWHYNSVNPWTFGMSSRAMRIQNLTALFNEQEVLEKYTVSDNPTAGPRWGQ